MGPPAVVLLAALLLLTLHPSPSLALRYLAPEVLLDDNGYSKLVDFWSLGVLLFEMCCGWSPFYAEDTQQMYKNICFGAFAFLSPLARDLDGLR